MKERERIADSGVSATEESQQVLNSGVSASEESGKRLLNSDGEKDVGLLVVSRQWGKSVVFQ
jgi:hypothetical protein